MMVPEKLSAAKIVMDSAKEIARLTGVHWDLWKADWKVLH